MVVIKKYFTLLKAIAEEECSFALLLGVPTTACHFIAPLLQEPLMCLYHSAVLGAIKGHDEVHRCFNAGPGPQLEYQASLVAVAIRQLVGKVRMLKANFNGCFDVVQWVSRLVAC
eukprot:1056341-Amphidinium_carterae.1